MKFIQIQKESNKKVKLYALSLVISFYNAVSSYSETNKSIYIYMQACFYCGNKQYSRKFKASIFTCTEQTPLVYISETNKYHYMTKKKMLVITKTFFTTWKTVQQLNTYKTRYVHGHSHKSCTAGYWNSMHVSKRSPGILCLGHFQSQHNQTTCIAIIQNTGALQAPARLRATACSLPQGLACTLYVFQFDHKYQSSYYLEGIHRILGLV